MNAKQVIGVTIAVMGVLAISSTELTDLFGPAMAKSIKSVALLLSSILGASVAAIGGTPTQSDQVRNVLNMPGVERLEVNAHATPALAQLAMDENINKIAPVAGADAKVAAIAEGAG